MAEARLGLARLGATRLGDYRPYVFLSVDGVARRLRIDHLTIRDTEGGVPNTATMRVSGFDPNEGEAIHIGLGALDGTHDIFAGHILTKRRIYEADNVANVAYDLSCISHEWRLDRRKVNARFTSQSATAIATALIAAYAPDFTVVGVEAGLPSIDEITFTNETLTDAFDRLTHRIGGAWYVDEAKDLHLFLSETQTATTIDDTHRGASRVTWRRDLSQVRTRVSVEGGGVTAIAPGSPGDDVLAVEAVDWYEETGGTVTSGPQRVTYTGYVSAGDGAQVGSTVTPTNGPTITGSAQSGLTAGNYKWLLTFGTAAGETLAGPPSATFTAGGTVAAPSSAPTPGTPTSGGSVTTGSHTFGVSFVNASGETAVSAASGAVTAGNPTAFVSPPSTPSLDAHAASTFQSFWAIGTTVSAKVTYVNALGETTPSGSSSAVTIEDMGGGLARAVRVTLTASADPSVTGIHIYFTHSGANSGRDTAGPFANTSTTVDRTGGLSAISPPGSNTAGINPARTIPLTAIPIGPTGTTARNLYRTAAGGSQLKYLGQIGNNTATTATDTTADGSLGANAPTSGTALALAADLSGIAIGPSGTTSRKVYRTVANGSTYKLQSTIANNTATTLTDTTADGSLGAAPPGTDTSGLVAQSGDVPAGASSLLVTATGPFRASGGWASIGSLAVRYTGISGTSLTGIPALGLDGSLGTTVRYGTPVIASPLLVGIPTSGAGAIRYRIAPGDEVNLLVTVDDLTAQATLADLLTAAGEPAADGVIEDYIQDRRLSSTEARARAQAQLTLVKDPLVTVTYETFDRFTRAGREVTFTSTMLGLTGTFKIQTVTMTEFDGAQRTFPRRQVVASSRRFTYESLLRQLRAT